MEERFAKQEVRQFMLEEAAGEKAPASPTAVSSGCAYGANSLAAHRGIITHTGDYSGFLPPPRPGCPECGWEDE